jgi:phosphoribosylaminoimidazole carboxylase
MVARSRTGDVVSYPVVETIHRESICAVTEAPANVAPAVARSAKAVAEKTVSCLSGRSCPSIRPAV